MCAWVIALPVWGDRYLDVFERATMPALRRAIDRLGERVTLKVYTDSPDRVTAAAQGTGQGFKADIYSVPGSDKSFGSLSACHAHVLKSANMRDRICLLTADMVVSEELLVQCNDRLNEHFHLVTCMGMRVSDTMMPTEVETVSGESLLSWGWDHRHRMTRECTWPDGTSYDVWRMYFEMGDEVACRLCLPHPIALEKRRNSYSFSPTIDVNLAHNFITRHIHLMTRPDEGAVIELSPPDKEFVVTETMRTRMKTRGPSAPPFYKLNNPRHKFFFRKKIIIKGSGGDVGDFPVVKRLL